MESIVIMKTTTEPTGEMLRDRGINLVISHNECYKVRFHDAAQRILDKFGRITSQDVVEEIGMPSGSANAVGGAMRGFALANKLYITGYMRAERSSRHSATVAIWKRVP